MATNAAYDRLFGGSEIIPEDLAGVPLPPADRPTQQAARGERFRMEFAVTADDGSRRWFEAVAEPLTGADRTWSGVIAIRDVSERTMRVSLERLMAAAGHELKTPTAANLIRLFGLQERLKEVGLPRGVGIGGVVAEDGRPTTRKMRLVTSRNQQVARVDYESDREAKGEIEAALIAAVERAASTAKAIVISDYLKGSVTRSVVA